MTLCKKAHLTNNKEWQLLANLIDDRLDQIRKHGDIAENVLVLGSDDEGETLTNGRQEEEGDKEEEEGKLSLVDCSGFLTLGKDKKKCTEKTNKHRHILTGDKTHYFCHGSHLVRYLLSSNCAQGKPAKEPKPSKASKSGQ
jgi:hypothetical protein